MKKGKIISLVAIGAIAAVTVTVNILALGVFRDTLQNFVFGVKVDASAASQNREAGEKLAKQIEEEGIVMVKNDNNVLPLNKKEDKKVNVFGWSASHWIPGGSGSGRVVDNSSGNSLFAKTGLLEALNAEGVETNEDLNAFYRKYANERPGYRDGTLNTYDYQYSRIIEPKISEYEDNLLEDAEGFSDTAIVVLGRITGESNDAPKVQYKGKGTTGSPDDAEKTYLDASSEELELLEYVAGTYKKVIVVVNSTNTMNLQFLDMIQGLDSCLVVGGSGINAATGIVSVLYGDTNPSGKLTDTYAYEFSSNPTFVNSGSDGTSFYTNGSGLYPADNRTTNPNVGNSPKYQGVSYLDYTEGIYVGYKWYETADHEGYWDDVDNEFGKGYEGVVQYPFGYGLSYTSFSWEVVDLSEQLDSGLKKDQDVSITVRVKNTGEVAGKDVVELYYTAPYIKDEIEKSYVSLVGFGKTQLLEPGKFEDITITFNVQDLASYDYSDANSDGNTGYELDSGEYQFKLMTDSHNVKEVVTSAASKASSGIISYNVPNKVQYRTDKDSKLDVDNKFTGEEAIDGVGIDGEDSGANIIYLSRADFKGTFPIEKEAARSMTDNVKALNKYTSEMARSDIDTADPDVTMGAKNDLKVYDSSTKELTELGERLGADFDDPEWEDLLDQLTENEMKNLTLHGYTKTSKVDSIGKPELRDVDGPNQIGSFNVSNAGTGFPNATVMAQTWSKELAYSFGLALGAETRTLGYSGWYGPGINIHRSPFGGRNYEYFSEDSYLTGVMAAEEIRGSRNQGVYCYLKHLICYEQESARDGIYVWLTEQALREIYLKPFRTTIFEGKANGIMTSYNRLGAVWAGGSKGLITGVLRDEWNFHGSVLTDYADHQDFMNGDQALRAGGDIWMDGYQNNGTYKMETTSNTFKNHLRRASKNIIYSWLNAIVANKNYDPENDKVSFVIGEAGEPNDWWVGTLIGVSSAIGVGLAVWAVLLFLPKKKNIEVI